MPLVGSQANIPGHLCVLRHHSYLLDYMRREKYQDISLKMWNLLKIKSKDTGTLWWKLELIWDLIQENSFGEGVLTARLWREFFEYLLL